jgi:hypothetical protein
VLIEQAIFTSAETDRAQGYQLVRRSSGLSEADARELSLWGPSHDSLVERPNERSSVNFFRLESGLYSVSRTTLEGAEYSGRGGKRVYTQFLVVPPDVLARFGNNAFAVLRAATAIGALEPRELRPEPLESLSLSGRAGAVDPTLLAQLSRDPGACAMATLVQAALSSDRLAVAVATSREQLISGLLNLLPVECRSEFSFTTALKASPSRPVRISFLDDDQAAWRATARGGVTLLDLRRGQASDGLDWQGWAGYVAKVLRSGKLSFLATELEQSRPGLTCAGLDRLSEEMESRFPESPRAIAVGTNVEQSPAADRGKVGFSGATVQRSDRAHSRQEQMMTAPAGPASTRGIDKLIESLAEQPAEVLELLERIDDLVFAAISGDELAMTELEVLWPTVVADLDEDLVERSREQYLRCALSICSESVEGGVQRPELAAAAMDVLCVLFED